MYPEYIEISPTLRHSELFHRGTFRLEKALIGWRIIRIETYKQQVMWVYDKGEYPCQWQTTDLKTYEYPLIHFFRESSVRIALSVLQHQYPSDMSLLPERIATLVEFLMDYRPDMSDIKSIVKYNRKHRSK